MQPTSAHGADDESVPRGLYEPPAVEARTSSRDPLVWTGTSPGPICCVVCC
jgi:hypothetical protein